jgi:hypothetical protein
MQRHDKGKDKTKAKTRRQRRQMAKTKGPDKGDKWQTKQKPKPTMTMNDTEIASTGSDETNMKCYAPIKITGKKSIIYS